MMQRLLYECDTMAKSTLFCCSKLTLWNITYILHRHTQAGKVVGIRLQLCNANFSLYCNAFGFESTVAEHKGYTVSMCTATLLPCSQIYCYSVVPSARAKALKNARSIMRLPV